LIPVHRFGVDIRNVHTQVRKTLVVSLYFFPEIFGTLHSLGKTRNTWAVVEGVEGGGGEAAGGEEGEEGE
jgi:hypothetical protein